MIVGSQDNCFRIFKKEEIIHEIDLAAKPLVICPLLFSRFASFICLATAWRTARSA